MVALPARFLTLLTGICLRLLRAIAWRRLDFEFDNFIPYRVGAVSIRNGEEFAQTAARILRLRLTVMFLTLLHVDNRRFNRFFYRRLLFIHFDIVS